MKAGLATIAALATAPFPGALAVIRISGTETGEILQKIFRPRHPGAFRPFGLKTGDFVSPEGEILDSGLAVFMPGPNSYTGEDYAELNLHGNPLLAARVLEALINYGVRQALPGEFTQRAFLLGKMDLSQCEGVDELLRASNPAACRAAWRLQNGELRKQLENSSTLAKRTLAGLQGAIEFGDDVAENRPLWRANLETILKDLEKILATAGSARIARDGLCVVICGKPNAGKSSLFNALLCEERALVAKVPGTTRDVLSGEILLGNLPVKIYDTAGLRNAKGKVEAMSVKRSEETLKQADLIIYVADGRHPVPLEKRYRVPLIKLQSKADLQTPLLRGYTPFSSKTGEGLEAIKNLILKKGGALLKEGESLVALRARHLDLLKRGVKATKSGLKNLGSPYLELVSEDVSDLVSSLGEITGETTPEEILDLIFREFCVGK